MGQPLNRQLVDDEDDRHSDLARILSERDSELTQQDTELGIGPFGQIALGD